ncbi:methyl-accepting chemotaxis protein [Fibrobacteres bacterium R8-0-B4]
MKLKYKLPLILFIAFVVVIALTFTVSLTNSAKAGRESQYEIGRSMAAFRSAEVKSFLEKKITELQALEQDIQSIMRLNDKDKADVLSKRLYAISNKPAVSDVYVTFERGAYFGADKTEEGKYYNIEVFLSESGTREIFVDPVEIADDDDWYNGPKKTMKLNLTEPYEWTYPDEKRPRKMFTLSAPVIADGKFVGVAGIDLQVDLIQKHLLDNMTDDKKGAYAALISNEGLIAAHPKEELLLSDVGADMDSADGLALKDAVKKGEYRRVLKKSLSTGDFSLVSYVPVQPDGIDSPWSLAYVVSLDVVQADAKKARNNLITLGVSCAVAWGVFLALFMSAVFGKITRTVTALGRMTSGDGDLTVRLDDRGDDELGQMARGLNGLMERLRSTIKTINTMTEGDGDLTIRFDEGVQGEFGQMARGLNSLMEKLHSTIKTTQTEAKRLSSTSLTLFEFSNTLSKSAETTLEESISVSAKSKETSGNVQEIASEAARASVGADELSATAEQMGSNMDTVIKAVGEMNESINRISANTRESKTIAAKAIDNAAAAVGAMDALEASVEEIGRFTDVIKTIAKKTNLLALNASVEAARAGNAGKGFAVVASEVKLLANQSTSNANDITQRIEQIHAGTTAAINVIRDISAIITKISGSAYSISESVESQMKVSEYLAETARQTNAGARQVVSAIGEVAASIQTSAKRAGTAAAGAQRVSNSIGVIRATAEKTNTDSTKLKEEANSLKNMAEHLDSIVCRFKTS